MLAGVKGDVGIGLYGEDLAVLQEKADELARVLKAVPGAADVKALEVLGLPAMQIVIDRDRIARYGINAADVLDVIEAVGGKNVGQVVEGQRRFALQVRFAPGYRDDVEAIRRLKIADPQGRMIPLEDLAEISLDDGVYEIWRKDRRRRVMITVNVRGRDLAGFVAEAQRRVGEKVSLPRGLLPGVGRHVREPPVGHASVDDRRADRPGPDLPPACSPPSAQSGWGC